MRTCKILLMLLWIVLVACGVEAQESHETENAHSVPGEGDQVGIDNGDSDRDGESDLYDGDYGNYDGDGEGDGDGDGEDGGYFDVDGAWEGAPADQFEDFGENEFVSTAEENTSTFSIDVNTASYTIARGALLNGMLPTPEGVRVEEFINFFRFEYPVPTEELFSINMEVAPSYFGSNDDVERHLLRIGVRGKDVSLEEMKPSNLVFLIDVSGSMSSLNRLPLAKQSLHEMLEHLRPTDTVAIQTYASGSDTVLAPTPVADRQLIEEAIDSLVAHGATWGEGGILAAYDLAEQGFIDGGNNRVIILTDGDFNVGKTGDDLVELVRSWHDREISLTSVGFGRGNYNDRIMEALARDGNGNYFYVDSIEEGKRIFGTHLPSTIEVIAADVKLQVEFDSDVVDRYRLVGYEKRVMDNADFDNDYANAGELGPGHTVTAFYEIEIHADAPLNSPFLAEVRVRHKEQYGEDSLEQSQVIKIGQVLDDFFDATDGFRFAAAVAEFAAILRGSQFVQGARFAEVHSIADGARYPDNMEQLEFLQLVTQAEVLWQ